MDDCAETEILIYLLILILKKKNIPLRKLVKHLICDGEKTNQPGPVRTEI